jgi:23S rRNA (guanine2445-N2)-methyltransferase / 23S rRNA (guanine2069-N7)-methyltransferase
MSRTYIDWAKRNFRLNKLDIKAHSFIQADCLDWLKQPDNKEKFELIFVDPPSFSNSKRMDTTLDIQRDHAALIRSTMAHLSTDGLLLFSTNLRRFKLTKEISEAYQVEDRTAASIPEDFARNKRIHQCWAIRHK